MFVIYLCVFLFSFFLSAVLVRAMIHLAPKIGYVDRPGGHKTHKSPIPYGGGVAVYTTFVVSMLFFMVIARSAQAGWISWPLISFVEPYLDGVFSTTVLLKIFCLAVAGAMIFFLGLVDDIHPRRPRFKLLVETLAACLVAYSDIRITLLISNPIINILITIVWIVVITNAFNLIDHADGLSSGVALIASFLFFAVTIQTGEVFVSMLIMIFIGSVAGFWIFNFPPASIFLGDAGSLFIGFIMAVTTILPTFFFYRFKASALPVLMPLLVLALPLFDCLSVVCIRLKNKADIFKSDRNHFAHRLKRMGMGDRESVIMIYLLCAAIGIAALLLKDLGYFSGLLLLLQAMLIVSVVMMLEITGRR